METLKDIRNLINSLKEVVRKKYKAEIIGIFGSFVRGEEKESSDIDILVEFKKDADLFDFVGLSIFLEEKLGRKIDIVPRDTLKPELKDIILKEIVSI